MKNKGKLLIAVIFSFIFWYLIFSFISADFNLWRWEGIVRALYVFISLTTANKWSE